MTFSEGGQFEGGRVRRGGGRSSGGRRIAVGGGGIGIGAVVVVLIWTLMGGNPADLLGGGTAGGGSTGQDQYVQDCTAQQANTDRECRLSAAAQSLDAFWSETLPAQAGTEYVEPGIVSFTDAVDTACGSATSATGPFYCPVDQTVYEDVRFFDELEQRFGASGGTLGEMYVTAHEFGHHIENQIGAFDRADRSGTGPDSDSVRIELMADCLAGMWAGHAATLPDPDTGVPFLEPITARQLDDALSAAAAVGDDHIQESAGQQVNPEAFTHGTSDQRVRWFTIGYEGGTIDDCDALEARSL